MTFCRMNARRGHLLFIFRVFVVGVKTSLLRLIDACSVCPDSRNFTLPEKAISIPGLESITTCQQLGSTVSILLSDNDPLCKTVQSLGTFCGCPKAETACEICQSGQRLSRPARELFFLSLEGIMPSCELFEAYLHSLASDDEVCIASIFLLADYCGCTSEADDILSGDDMSSIGGCSLCQNMDDLEMETEVYFPGFPLNTCGQFASTANAVSSPEADTCLYLQASIGTLCGCSVRNPATQPCTLCSDRSAPSRPSQMLPLLSSQFAGLTPTCEILEASLLSVELSSDECKVGHLLGGVCGCAPVEDHCVFCPEGDPIPEYLRERELPQFARFLDGLIATCADIEQAQTQIPTESLICSRGKHRKDLCCGGHFQYLGTSTVRKQAVLAWLPRGVALLSILGSTYVLSNIVRHKERRATIFHRIMIGLTVSDIVSAVAWGFTTLPVPANDDFGAPSKIYGARGNGVTCAIQGFFIQLGFTSIFFNVALTTYYVLVIVYNWRETRLIKLQYWFYTIPVLLGSTLAFAGIPFYTNNIMACYVNAPPLAEKYTVIALLAVVPVCFVVLFCTTAMARVYLHVRHQQKRASNWRMGGSGKCIEQQVLWQSVFYVGAFYISWPIQVVGIFMSEPPFREHTPYAFWLLMVSLAPIQGLLNFFVYIRPRLSKKRDSAGSSPADSGIQGSSWLLSTRFAKVLSIFERQREARDETSLLNEQVSHKRNEANDLDPKDFQEDPLSGF